VPPLVAPGVVTPPPTLRSGLGFFFNKNKKDLKENIFFFFFLKNVVFTPMNSYFNGDNYSMK